MNDCVRCGYCCTVAPCAYGRWNEEMKRCDFLREQEDGISACALYPHLINLPGAAFSPAFGTGCSSSLFNERRERLLKSRDQQ